MAVILIPAFLQEYKLKPPAVCSFTMCSLEKDQGKAEIDQDCILLSGLLPFKPTEIPHLFHKMLTYFMKPLHMSDKGSFCNQ